MADYRDLMKQPEEWTRIRYDDPRLDAFAEEVEDKYGLPPGILVAIKNAGEKSNTGQVSSAQARGVMQFIPSTMRLQNGKFMHNPDNPFESILAAGRYLQHTMKYQYNGQISLAIADYNTGGPNVTAWQRGERPLAEETQRYLVRVRDYITGSYKERLSQRLQQRQQGREPNGEQ